MDNCPKPWKISQWPPETIYTTKKKTVLNMIAMLKAKYNENPALYAQLIGTYWACRKEGDPPVDAAHAVHVAIAFHEHRIKEDEAKRAE